MKSLYFPINYLPLYGPGVLPSIQMLNCLYAPLFALPAESLCIDSRHRGIILRHIAKMTFLCLHSSGIACPGGKRTCFPLLFTRLSVQSQIMKLVKCCGSLCLLMNILHCSLFKREMCHVVCISWFCSQRAILWCKWNDHFRDVHNNKLLSTL